MAYRSFLEGGGYTFLLRHSYVANTPTRRFYADADLAYLVYLTREPPLRKPTTRPLPVAAVSVTAHGSWDDFTNWYRRS